MPKILGDFETKISVTKAAIVDTSLLKVRGLAHVYAGNTSETNLSFDQDDVDEGTIKRAETETIAESVVTSLLGDLKLEVQVLGLSLIAPSTVSAAVGQTLGLVAVCWTAWFIPCCQPSAFTWAKPMSACMACSVAKASWPGTES